MRIIAPKHLMENVYPTVRNGGIFNASSLDLQFARTKTLDPRITFTRASSGTYVGADGLIKTAATNEARFDHNPTTGESLGLLVEEQRTNSIRNNTMVGAVAGTPGTLPTNWVIQGSGVGTLTQEIVRTGTQNGINYIDIKYSGTTSTTDLRIAFEPSTQITAALNQSWTASAYTAVVAGSLSNITSVEHSIVERNAAGGFLAESVQVVSATSSLVRGSLSRTLSSATVERINSAIKLSFLSGVAINVTLRIGLPQLEQGAFATSVIPTTTATVTRSADVTSISSSNFSGWSSSQGTLYGEGAGSGPLITLRSVAGAAERVQLAIGSSAVITANTVVAGNTNTSAFKRVIAYQLDNTNWAYDGVIQTVDTSCAMPTLEYATIGYFDFGAAQRINGTIRRLTYWPQRLSNSTLQQITQ